MRSHTDDVPAVSRGARVAVAAGLVLSVAVVSAGCAQLPVITSAPPSASSTPFTPAPPRAVDLRTATQALSLQISARSISVDGLDCRTDGVEQASTRLRCTVVTGGAGHPDRIAEALWNTAAGTVRLLSIEPVPSTPPPPLATVPLAAADDAELPAAQVTRAVRAALIAAGDLERADAFACGDLHSSVAGCEGRTEGTGARYWNVLLKDSALSIYRALP